MLKKLVCVLIASSFFLMIGSHAMAQDKEEGFIGLGTKFSWDNTKAPVLSYAAADVKPGMSSLDYGSPKFGGEFQWGIKNKLALTASLDFGSFSHSIYPWPEKGSLEIQSTTHNFLQLGVLVGAKYYFAEPEAGKAVLYLNGAAGKYFAKSSTKNGTNKNAHAMESNWNNDNPSADWDDYIADGDGFDDYQDALEADTIIEKELEMMSDLASPFIFQMALGAEFWATDAFSVGADIFGVRLEYAKSNVKQVMGTDANLNQATWTGEQSYLNIFVYSALTINFNLTAGKSTSESAEKETKEEPAADLGWGAPAPTPDPAQNNNSWGNTNAGWSTGPVAPAPAPVADPTPAPVADPTPAAPGSVGGNIPPPPPPPAPVN